MRALLVVAALARIAAADDPRKAAEQLEKDGKQTKDPAKLDACGKAYLAIYNAAPKDAGGDELLYNSAVCFEEGGSAAAALQNYALLQRDFPRSMITRHAVARMGKLYADLAQYDRAAAAYEQYVSKYSSEKDAFDALSDAVMYRTALGDNEKRVRDTMLAIKLFGAKGPRRGEEVAFALTAPFGTPAEQITRLRAYVKQWGGKSHEHLAIASTKLGDLLSAQSCPVPLALGLCIKLIRDAKPKRCGADTLPRVVVVKRTAVYKEAQAAYQQALKTQTAQPSSGHAWALGMAKIGVADQELEQMLAAGFPSGLDFDPAHADRRQQSQKKLDDWLAAQSRAGTSLARSYKDVLALKDLASSVAAMLRLAQSVQALERALLVGELPKDVTSGQFAKDKTAAYCEIMRMQAVPLAEQAIESLRTCIDKAREYGISDPFSRACWREAQLAKPNEFPQHELHADPSIGPLDPILDAAPADEARKLSNLGEEAWRRGDHAAAATHWERALAKNPKLAAAHTNLAVAQLERWRALPTTAIARKQLEADLTLHAQSALALDHDDATPYVVLAHVALDNRKPDLATQLLTDAFARNDALASALELRAVLYASRDAWPAAIAMLERALASPRASDSTRLAAALASLRVGRYDAANKYLAMVKVPSYDADVARGVAARGLGELDKAEAAYQAAIKRDTKRAEAHYDLALLYEAKARRDPSARKQLLAKAVAAYRNAAALDAKLDAAARADAIAKQLASM